MSDPADNTDKAADKEAEKTKDNEEVKDETNGGDNGDDASDGKPDSASTDGDSGSLDGDEASTDEPDQDSQEQAGADDATDDDQEQDSDEVATDAELIFTMMSEANETIGQWREAPYRIAETTSSKNPVYNELLAQLQEKMPGGITKGKAVVKETIQTTDTTTVAPEEKAVASGKSVYTANIGTESNATMLSEVNILAVYEAQKAYAEKTMAHLSRVKLALQNIDRQRVISATYTPTNAMNLMCSSNAITDGDMLLSASVQTLEAVKFNFEYLHKYYVANVDSAGAALATAAKTGNLDQALAMVFSNAVQCNKIVHKLIEAKLVPATDTNKFAPTVSGISAGHFQGAKIVPTVALINAGCLAVAVRDSITSVEQLFTSGLFVDSDPLSKSKAPKSITVSLQQIEQMVDIGLEAAKVVIDYEKQAKQLQHSLEGLVAKQLLVLQLAEAKNINATANALKLVKRLPASMIYRFAGGNADLNVSAFTMASIACDLTVNLTKPVIAKRQLTLNYNGNDMRKQYISQIKVALESLQEGQEETKVEAKPQESLVVADNGEGDTTPGPEAALGDVDVSPEDAQAVVKDLDMQEQAQELTGSLDALESLQDALKSTVRHGSSSDMRRQMITAYTQHNRIRASLGMGYLPTVAVEDAGGVVPAMEGLIESVGNTIRAVLTSIKKFFADIAERRAEAALRARAQKGDITARITLIKRKVSLLTEVKGRTFQDPRIMQNLGLWKACPDVKTALEASQHFHDIYVQWFVRNYEAQQDMIAEVQRGSYDGIRKVLVSDIEDYAKNVFPEARNPHAVISNLGKEQHVRFAPSIPGNSALGVVMPNEIYNERYQGDHVGDIRVGDFSSGPHKSAITAIKCATEQDLNMIETMAAQWEAAFLKGRDAYRGAMAANNDTKVIADWIYQEVNERHEKSSDVARMAYRYFGSFMYHSLSAFDVRAALRYTVFSAALSWVEESIMMAEQVIAARPMVETN